MEMVEISMDIYEVFEKRNISYEEIEHEPVFTIEQAMHIKRKLPGTGCKNLFLTDKKGTYILVVLEDKKRAELKEIAKIAGTSRLSFASQEELKEILSLEAGGVTPLGIIHDVEHKVVLMIDRDLQRKRLLVHPNVNTRTVSISCQDLIRLIEFETNRYMIF